MSGKDGQGGQSQNGHLSEKSQNQSSGGTSSGAPKNWYLSEILQMMYGFGDVPKPQHDSAVLIEDIVKQQLTSVLLQAADVASSRNGRFIGLEDILFLLRKDKVKLRRLLRYMGVKDQRSMAMKGVEEGEEDQGGEKVAQPVKTRLKMCYNYLSSIDATGELLALFEDGGTDEVKRERLLRAELQTRYMDQKQYMEYVEARQASFARRSKAQRFKDWLLTGITMDLKPNQHAMEIINYFAYETVAQIVDMALLVKQDKKSVYGNPVPRNGPNVCINYYNQISLGSGISAPPSTTQGSTSPVQSPPATPTTPGSTLSLSSSSSSLSASLPKPKSKKRKKSGIGSALEISTAIQPEDIHEAMRRYCQCIGPFSSHIKTNPMVPPHTRLLCL
ncbi:transcription initiation protein SPT3 homolog [Saccostrea echinata]|uniref:transcription initiation protein SPT3 homolog n=1 Tax=Saccostrea echinata TaxID=191078 RepID=UPI002A81C467|nr:transcription initiation protein SPT3 homolog [Saccostrea echinata]XP_061177162.1 transcription initiation protein SPT3 homolog [Saccostrea echinata]XP_061177163.1 transcription initiation protein SPT3 homolog [Saccostrea echinata]